MYLGSGGRRRLLDSTNVPLALDCEGPFDCRCCAAFIQFFTTALIADKWIYATLITNSNINECIFSIPK